MVGECRIVVWSGGIRVRGWVVGGVPEWYEVVAGVPCLDFCVMTRCECE